MPSLRDLDALHRLNAPTRAAATRRRRLRKAFAVLCLLAAAFILTPPTPSAGARAHDAGAGSDEPVATDAAVKGLHLVVLPAGTAVPPQSARVDVWGERGERLIRCAPMLPPRETASRLGTVTSTTPSEGVTVALTDEQMRTMVPVLAESHGSTPPFIVSSCG